MSSNAADITAAGLNCLSHGCIASTGPEPHERCRQSGCMAHGYVQPPYVPARRPDGHTLLCDADSCVCGLMGSGFEGMTGDLAAKSPTDAPACHGEGAQGEASPDFPNSWPGGEYACPTCAACGFRQFAGPKGAQLCYVCWQSGIRMHSGIADTATEAVRAFTRWYYTSGNVNSPAYRQLTADLEARMLTVLGAEDLGRLGKT